MNKIILDVINYGIQHNYQFIYRIPAKNSKGNSDYIDMYVDTKDVDIDAIWNYVKSHIEDTENKTIILNLKKWKYKFELIDIKRSIYY